MLRKRLRRRSSLLTFPNPNQGGFVPNAVNFNGGSYLQGSYDPGEVSVQAGNFCGFVYLKPTGGDTRYIFSFIFNASQQYHMWLNDDGTVSMSYTDTAGPATYSVRSAAACSPDVWNSVLFCLDSDNKQNILMINNEVNSWEDAGDAVVEPNNGRGILYLGSNESGEQYLNAGVSMLWLDLNTTNSWPGNESTILPKFITVASGAPLDLGINGEDTGLTQPFIWLPNPAASWVLNGGYGGDFFTLQSGELTDIDGPTGYLSGAAPAAPD